MRPYLQDVDFTLYVGDVTEVLAGLPDESVHCVVTSPPYWGLRDYGTGVWASGDPNCDHLKTMIPRALDDPGIRMSTLEGGKKTTTAQAEGSQYRDACGKCGATRIDQQLGLEPTPELYVENMVGVFREVRRVLRRDGTCWLNVGDSYVSDPGKGGSGPGAKQGAHVNYGRERMAQVKDGKAVHGDVLRPYAVDGLRPKNLVGIPWRLAFALQQDGWYLRSEIVWSKPNPMPESVTDRPTKAHEQVFLLTRSPRYFYDADAVREPHESTRWGGKYSGPSESWKNGSRIRERDDRDHYPEGGRNMRSVWEIATQPYPEAHFATFPEALVERCVKAGSPAGGTILDPFMGSGTTALVARNLGRRSIGIELNEQYAQLAAHRLSQQSLLTEVS